MTEVLQGINRGIWGVPLIVLILVTGIWFSLKTGFAQLIKFPAAFRIFIKKMFPSKPQKDGISGFQALCTALAATVGTGNIVGVAGAICLGGPGAIFWMWICAFFGMIIKCAEAVIAISFRKKSDNGEWVGGPMQMIEYGMGARWKWMACLYAFFGVVAAFGVGNATQINAVISGIHSAVSVAGIEITRLGDILIAAVISFIIALILSGGAKRIGNIAQKLVPLAAVIYIVMGLGVLILRANQLPNAFRSIFQGAFHPSAVTGGIIGSFYIACRTGAARGVFTNEAGMGTASIAHASADVSDPLEQGFMGIIEVFIDTIVMCTVTALVILCSGFVIPYGIDAGATLTSDAFSMVYGDWASVIIAICLILFAVATVIGWSFYGLRCAQYLLGEQSNRIFIIIQAIVIVVSVLLETDTIWLMAESMNGLMAIPNLIALLFLSPHFLKLINDSENLRKKPPLR